MRSTRRILAALAGLMVCSVVHSPPIGAAGAAGDSRAVPSTRVPRIDPAPASITVSAQPFNILTSVNATFSIVPPTAVSLTRSDLVEVRLHRRVASRESLRTIADGLAVPSVIDRHTVRVSAATRDAAGRLSIIVPISTDDEPRSLEVPWDGIYPVSIALIDGVSGEDLASALTFINRRSSATTTIDVQAGVVVNLRTAPSLGLDGVVTVTDALRTEVSRLISFLTEVPGPVTVVLQPEAISALAQSSVPEDALLLLTLRQQLAGRTVAAATFAAVDPALLAALDLEDEYIEQLRLGTAVLSRYLPGVPVKNDTLFVTTALDRPAIALLRKAGITNVILAPGARQSTESEARPAVLSHPSGRDNEFISLISADPTASEAIATAGASPVATAYRIAAELLAERDDLVAAGVTPEWIRIVATSPSGVIPESGVMNIVARALSTSPGLDMIDLTNRQFVSTSHPATVFQPTIDDPGNARRAGLVAARREMLAVMSMVTEDDPRRQTWEHMLAIGASESSTDPREWVAALRSALRQVRESVVVITPSNITLSSRSTSVRLQIRNESDAALVIRLRLSSAKLELTDPVRLVELPPRTLTEVEVPATTRTNGRFPITVRIITPEGALEVIPTISITARVTAIAGLGQLVSISLLLVLLAWWWSHRRKTRTADRMVPVTDSGLR